MQGWPAGENSVLEICIRVWLHFTPDMQFDQIEMPLGKSTSRELKRREEKLDMGEIMRFSN